MTKKPVELDRSRTPLVLVVVGIVGGLLTAGAIMWGRSDVGMIDVTATIANSDYATHGGGENGATPEGYATQEHTNLPNGGLVPANSGSTPAPAPPPAPENASTTAPGADGESVDTVASSSGETTEATSETSSETPTEQNTASGETASAPI